MLADAFPVSYPWMRKAACRDHPELDFFPPRGASLAPLVAVCRACPVRHECLEYAMTNGERYGIWGGTTEQERRRIRRRRRLLASAETLVP
jgi:WhiB family redox-sensing transcriptional regulator